MRAGIIIAAAVGSLLMPWSAFASRDDAASRALLKNVAAARGQIDRVLSDLRKSFEESSEIRDARSTLRTAQLNYKETCATALQPLRQTPGYKQAAQLVLSLERRLAWGRFDDHMNDQQKADTAATLLRARLAVSKLESKALAENPDVASARYAMIDANGKLVALQRSFSQSILSDSLYLEARARLDEARSQIPRSR